MRILIFRNGLDIIGELLVVCSMALFQTTGNLIFDGVAGMLHVGNILSKLGAANRTEAASLAREHDLVAKTPRPDN